LNSYSYVINNPVKYVDTDGATEWWALFLPGTYSQLSFWGGVSSALNATGNNIASSFLSHSISVEPGNMIINKRNDKTE